MTDPQPAAPGQWHFEPDELDPVLDEIRADPSLLIAVPWARKELSAMRVAALSDTDIRTFRDHRDTVARDVVDYNIESMRVNPGLERVEILVGVLFAVDAIRRRAPDLDVLAIGPRTEHELFALLAGGFSEQRLRGLDLISYNPLVDLGDMHDMPYGDDSFDVVFFGWTMTYSTDVPRVAAEVVRVARPGAYVAIGIGRDPYESDEARRAEQGEDYLEATYYRSTKDILANFEGAIDSVVFEHDVDPKLQTAGEMMVVFRLK